MKFDTVNQKQLTRLVLIEITHIEFFKNPDGSNTMDMLSPCYSNCATHPWKISAAQISNRIDYLLKNFNLTKQNPFFYYFSFLFVKCFG